MQLVTLLSTFEIEILAPSPVKGHLHEHKYVIVPVLFYVIVMDPCDSRSRDEKTMCFWGDAAIKLVFVYNYLLASSLPEALNVTAIIIVV